MDINKKYIENEERVANGQPFMYQGDNYFGIDVNPISREVIPDEVEEKAK